MLEFIIKMFMAGFSITAMFCGFYLVYVHLLERYERKKNR